MWICSNCETENEDNFKFCWSCGQTREKSKVADTQKISEAVPPKVELKKEPVREIKKVEEIKPKVEPKTEPKPVEDAKPAEITNVEKRNSPKIEPELFSTVLPYAKNSSNLNNETDWEIKVVRIAVRLVGLFLIYQFIVALPGLTESIVWEFQHREELSDPFRSKELIVPVARNFFYLIVGIYLIASGRIFLWLLPDR